MSTAKRTSSQLRRKPQQERSRERVDAILKTAMQLIGEKGIDAVTMKEVAARSGGPLASVYQYFPNKSAILATLYERFSETSREQLTAIVAGVSDLDGLIEASDRLLDNYYSRVAGDPAIQDLQNAIQADKALQNLDITETRLQASLFYDASVHLVAPARREAFGRMVFLIFQLAGSVVRLTLTQDRTEGRQMFEDYRSIVHGQLRLFGDDIGRAERQDPARA
jgi:AcrR family transcriptional regulator